jgi:hypothetical protein
MKYEIVRNEYLKIRGVPDALGIRSNERVVRQKTLQS